MRTLRTAARLLVVAPDGAVFLFRYDDDEIGLHWTTPGGGLEAGETPREGAVRELREETGWSDLEPGPLLCTWVHDYTRAGVPVRQHEHIFLARGPRRELSGDLAAMHTADRILRWRWWMPQELADFPELLLPPQLPALVTAVLREAPAAPAPIDLGYVPLR
ncbi:NUDIX domain-containing protein [Actinocrinis puniceicyclus]|uniref:NUDIX domain-containing protein n=1 Tax=Actinocrinis puniceicyclus TaxID=977794 RepID=A0A8J8BDF3_9ACTN|nr:NUDIX domain-containing protein [Actinocrinis puniceicyclus]MBS2965198.1 NUDIX domain-containing protein [Actinocrinis puniceicyclus]